MCPGANEAQPYEKSNPSQGDSPQMATVGVVTDCTETVEQLETLLGRRGHRVMEMGVQRGSSPPTESDKQRSTLIDLVIVDIDGRTSLAVSEIRLITENASTALTPVLVAASTESHADLAVACAYGASGLLSKPFSWEETMPDAERAIATDPASQ